MKNRRDNVCNPKAKSKHVKREKEAALFTPDVANTKTFLRSLFLLAEGLVLRLPRRVRDVRQRVLIGKHATGVPSATGATANSGRRVRLRGSEQQNVVEEVNLDASNYIYNKSKARVYIYIFFFPKFCKAASIYC